MNCTHEDCGYNERVWLPINDEPAEVAKHPYCKHCGAVKNLSNDRAIKIGYFMNALLAMSKLSREKVITDVQIRLVSKDLNNVDDFEDRYWMRRSIQENLFVKIVKRYSSLSEPYIKSFL